MRLTFFLLGSFIGAPTRYVIDRYFRGYMKFPLGILIVNVAGSFLLGLTLDAQTNTAFALMGFCGALTTWSAFALDLYDASEKKNYRGLALNLLSNYGLGVLAASAGLWVAS
jgi:fluoride exporter